MRSPAASGSQAGINVNPSGRTRSRSPAAGASPAPARSSRWRRVDSVGCRSGISSPSSRRSCAARSRSSAPRQLRCHEPRPHGRPPPSTGSGRTSDYHVVPANRGTGLRACDRSQCDPVVALPAGDQSAPSASPITAPPSTDTVSSSRIGSIENRPSPSIGDARTTTRRSSRLSGGGSKRGVGSVPELTRAVCQTRDRRVTALLRNEPLWFLEVLAHCRSRL